jgi:nitrile hydratase
MRVLTMDNVEAVLKKGDSARLDMDIPARFGPGDAVITRNFAPLTHTRLPRYARARHGVVKLDHGVFVFPDTHAIDWERKPQHLYAVEFTMRELWGEGASERDTVILDLFDDYLVAG